MAIVKAVQKWRPYLIGRKFIVRTDQMSLKYILEQRVVGSDYQRWVTKLMGFDFEVQYRTGESNRVADALSRKEPTPVCDAMEVGLWKFWEKLKLEIQGDEFIQQVKADLETHSKDHRGFSLLRGNLLFKGRLVVPAKSALKDEIIREFHDSPIGGHAGEKKTYQRVASEVFWTGMRMDIVDYIRKCIICQQHKALTSSPSGLLQPIPLPEQMWDEITMDFIEGLPKSDGWDTIWVVVDRLSKYAHFIPLRHPFSAATVANSFMKEVFRLHGLPKSIISDRDRIFLSQFWLEMFRLHGVDLKRSTAYHPQTDGQSEVVNRCLETYLRCFCSEKPKQWARWLAWAEFWYEGQQTAIDTLDRLLEDRDAILDDLRVNLIRAQQKMQTQANKHHRDVEFQEGEWVYLKLRPYRQQSLAKRRFEKLAARYYDPFRINKRVGKVAYKLELPPSSLVHPTFHVSQLKVAYGVPTQPTELLPQLNAELELLVQPDNVRREN